MLMLESEFSRILKLCGGGKTPMAMSELLRKSWDADKVIENNTKNNPERSTNALISLIGHITPAELNNLMATVDIQNGFANRILWIACVRSKVLPRAKPVRWSSDESIIQDLRRCLEKVAGGSEFRFND